MAVSSTHLRLDIVRGRETDPEELEELTRQLHGELSDLDVDAIDFPDAGKAPRGAKGDPLSLGTLLVTLAASGGVLTTLITTVQSWLTRHNAGSISLEIGGDKLSVTGLSSKEQQRLIEDWITRHKHE